MACSACSTPAPDGAKFCLECGQRLTPAVLESRKTVTAVFCDVTGSTALGDARDPEALRSVMTRYFAAMRGVLEAHGGTVEKFIGDAVMAVFGVPIVHEDDAIRAVRAAVGMQAEIARLNDQLDQIHGVRLAIRIGVNTGEVVVGDGSSGTVATGDAINVAARLEQAAAAGEVLIGASTHALVRGSVDAEPVAPLMAKGKPEPLAAWRVGAASAAPRAVTHGVPLIGRSRELGLLRQAADAAVRDRSCHLVTVLGTPGVGKTRLVGDFVDGLDGVQVLRGRCPAYGDTGGLWPLAEIVRNAAGFAGDEPPGALAAALSAIAGDEVTACLTSIATGSGSATPDEIQWAVRRLVAALARERPLVVLLDDIHWAGLLLLDVVDHLTDWIVDAPVLLLCVARPELLESRPGWAGGRANATSTLLQPLGDAASDELAAALLHGVVTTEATRERVLAAAGGMPLYVEQMVAMLADSGGDTDVPFVVPPTIQALLAARVEGLAPEERAVLGAASVIGQVFYRGGLAALTTSTNLTPIVGALVRKDFLRPAVSDLPGEDAIAFRHVLLRDAAYATLPKATRADLHERFGRWLAGRGQQQDESHRFVVHHLAQAVGLRDELGPRDAPTEVLAAETVDRLVALARRQVEVDASAAGVTFDEAAALSSDPLVRARVLVERSFLAAADQRETSRCLGAAREALRWAGQAGDDRLRRLAELRIDSFSLLVDAEDEHVARVQAERVRFASDGDDEGEATALACLCLLDALWAAWDDLALLAGDLLRIADRLSGWQWSRAAVGLSVTAAVYGSEPIPAALEVIDESIRRARGPRSLTRALGERAGLLIRAGREQEAAAALAERDRLSRETGFAISGVERASVVGISLALIGRWDEAIECLDAAIAELALVGDESFSSTMHALRAQARAALGDLAGAAADVRMAVELGTDDDVVTQSALRVAQVRIHLARGEDAVGLAREAAEIAYRGQGSEDQATAEIELARALRATERGVEARDAYRRAHDLLARRAATAMLRNVDAELAELPT